MNINVNLGSKINLQQYLKFFMYISVAKFLFTFFYKPEDKKLKHACSLLNVPLHAHFSTPTWRLPCMTSFFHASRTYQPTQLFLPSFGCSFAFILDIQYFTYSKRQLPHEASIRWHVWYSTLYRANSTLYKDCEIGLCIASNDLKRWFCLS